MGPVESLHEPDDRRTTTPLAGSVPGFPDLSWDDFKRASELAVADTAALTGTARQAGSPPDHSRRPKYSGL